MASKDSKKTITRRSFLQIFTGGLAAFYAAMAGLINPNLVKAAPTTCEETRCGDRYWGECIDGRWHNCEEHACWDKYSGALCSHSSACYRTNYPCD